MVRHAFLFSPATALLAIALHALPLAARAAPPDTGAAAPGVAFSAGKPGGPLPAGWQNMPVVRGKTLTQYTLVADQNTTVLQADATSAASALLHEGDIDLSRTPVVRWRWRAAPVPDADNSVGNREDAPARLVFFFDGQSEKLTLGERAEMEFANGLGGEKLPYATLMYIWTASAPPGTVIANPHTNRVQMIVVSGASGDVGKWLSLSRNVASDFEKVFHEKPGRLTGYALLTDTDNTGATTRAWYGDVSFVPGS